MKRTNTIFRTNYLYLFGMAKTGLFLLFFFSVPFSENWGGASMSAQGKGKFLTAPFENKVFIEEQGQFKKALEEINISFAEPILFAINNSEFKAYFTNSGIHFVFAKTEKTEEEDQKDGAAEKEPLTKWEIINLQWENKSPSMHIIANEKVKDYYTFGKYPDNSQYDHVSAFKKLYYTNIYEGVDAEFILPENGGIKYQFIVHAGFKIPGIAYRINGTKQLYKDDQGNLHIESTLGNLIDKTPTAFTKNGNVPVEYNISGDLVEINTQNKNLILTEDLVIDPWIIDPALPSTNIACDLQEDSVGNIYVNGGTSGVGAYQVQKYTSAGVLIWSHDYSCSYYGAIAVANSGSVYYTDGISGKVTKLNNAGSVLYSISEGSENWRLSFNRSKTILVMGGNFGSNSLTKIDTATGVMGSTVSYPSDTWAVATDCNGDIYSLHFGASPCILRKTNADFTPATSLTTSFCITGYANVRAYASGYNAITISGPYLYIYDGLDLRRFLKSTLTFVNSVPVPNGAANNCSGIAFDYCGNIYVGTMNTIEKYDMLLNHLSSITTPNIVYDIQLSNNGDLLACGKSFVANLGPTCPAPPQLTSTASSTNVSCKPGTATIYPVGGTMPYSYLWQPGGQTTDTINGLIAGTYTYIVNDAFCQSKQDSVVVLQTAALSLSPGSVVKESCLNSFNGSAMVHASGGTGPYSYSWNTTPVQTSFLASGLSAGTYIATVIDADSCIDTLSVIIARNPDPVAKFGNTTVCNSTATQFTDSSTTAAGTINYWSWNYGDATPLIHTAGPSHIYANAGNYNVTLIVNNNFGCGDTITKPVQVYFNPVATFSVSNVCLGDSMLFANSSTVDPSTAIDTYLWVFGDGSTTSSLQSPGHYYNTQGTYNVTLVTHTIDGCSDAENVAVKAFDPPIAHFTFNNTCLLYAAAFTNTTTSPTMGNTANWSWDFGDGSALNTTVLSPTHHYINPGNYQVTLTTYSSNLACPDTLKDSITIYPMPVAGFGVADVCLHQAMNFYDSSNVSSGSIATRSWNFGDGTSPNGNPNPTHIYMNPGTFTVTLIVTTDNGCKDTIAKSVVVHPLPVVQFSRANVCDGSIFSFNDLSHILTTDTIQAWAWNFADGSMVLNNQNSTHIFANAGPYAVQLTAISNFGCSDSITKTSIVNPNPVVDFTSSDTAGCEPLCIDFINSSTIATGNNTTWGWSFGDGSPVSGSQNPNHCYNNDSAFAPVSFDVTLTVKSDSGCVTVLTKTNYITVYPRSNANFTVQPKTTTITDPVITITDLSTGTYYWNWNFGDGSTPLITAMDTSAVFSPDAYTYQDTGMYVMTLITSTQYNCTDTAYETIIIEPDFIFYIPNAFTPDGDGINDTFSGKGIFTGDYEMTIFDRWGNLIYKTADINKPWDGKANQGAGIAQGDVYIYSIKIVDFKKQKHAYKGVVTLVR